MRPSLSHSVATRRTKPWVSEGDHAGADGAASTDIGNLALLSVLLLLAFAATLALATMVLRTRGLSTEAPASETPAPAALAMR